ncbi:ATPase inhibitor, mitochondrial isoform X2 [Manis pentadactyla]|uniref:ATPase inhibitor, mitochondrial isoform X2 n=1 Tax=Manis pentadactyla TaxID=143292 RepID=UPI001875653A|nr:ATPase inhibitor, mitochondrial isoform X2 [Manis pentadactyla]
MAALALAARMRLGVGAVKALEARGYGSDRSDRSDAGSIREAGGAFGKREQAEEERFFRCPGFSNHGSALTESFTIPTCGILSGSCETPPNASRSV